MFIQIITAAADCFQKSHNKLNKDHVSFQVTHSCIRKVQQFDVYFEADTIKTKGTLKKKHSFQETKYTSECVNASL